jgi:hypothetical protein
MRWNERESADEFARSGDFALIFENGASFVLESFIRFLAKGAASSAAPMQGERCTNFGDMIEAVCKRWACMRVLSGVEEVGEVREESRLR